MDSREMLRRLGSGESIAALCQAAGWSPLQFDAWWRQETAGRAPCCAGRIQAAVRGEVSIDRDRYGIPHIFAAHSSDLWFGFGYAMAQDRLFQLDYLRRKALGCLAEVLGPEGLTSDRVSRTVGLNRIARDELTRLPAETLATLNAFAAGVNAWIEQATSLPIEFDLLGYRPQPWSALDSVAVENEFRWYLTGRFPVIVAPELAKRTLREGPLLQELLTGEADDEAILPPETYSHMRPGRVENVGQALGDHDGTGSNNWVVAGRLSRSGSPLVASDPHIAFEAVSCWYQAHLCGGGLNVAGMAYVGMPAIMFGRNERVAWGITNNICSLRDLYQERTDPDHPGCFFYDGRWEAGREVIETIAVRGQEDQQQTIRFSRNGPIVDEILPAPADQSGPVALKWLGAHEGGWLTALLAMNRAATVREFREALRPWHVPTFNLVIADVDGHIAMQSAGRIPVRQVPERGYRPGWDPRHQWQGLVPFEDMPHAINPARGWLATANNRVAARDYPYPLAGCWSSGYRARRIRQMIEAGMSQRFAVDDFRQMQGDTLSLRAQACVPPLLAALSQNENPRVGEAVGYLSSWDGLIASDAVAPTLFNVFHALWSKAVAGKYFTGPALELLARQAEGVASRLLADDPHGWFPTGERTKAIEVAFVETLKTLAQRFGEDMSQWTWGRLHQMPLKHVLSARGDLGQLLDHGHVSVGGDMVTVCNTGSGPQFLATSGAGYRFIADLATAGLWAIDAQSQSGHVNTVHYSDQLEVWQNGRLHFLPLERDAIAPITIAHLVLSDK